jgi:hypothetical protein
VYVVLRKIKGRWSVAVDDVEEKSLRRVMTMWQALGYEVMSAKQPSLSWSLPAL